MTIPYGKQQIDEQDLEAVLKVLRSDWLTQGPVVQEFETALAAHCQSQYAVVFSSGTAALHAASFAAGISNGDEVITSPISFVSSANCAEFLGGTARFADIDLTTAQITQDTVLPQISKNTKAIIPVDLTGYPGDVAAIYQTCQDKGLTLIRDACHSFGATYQDSKTGKTHSVGSCAHADMTCFSFHPVKSFTTGEGGAVTTNSQDLYSKLQNFRQHGITKNSSEFSNKEFAQEPWYYEMQNLGYNYRLSDIHCALGLSQLGRVDENLKKRQDIVNTYRQQLQGHVEFLAPDDDQHKSAHHLFVIRVEAKRRNQLMKELRERGILTQLHYIPIYRQPYYQERYPHITASDYPNSELYFATAISLPIYADLSTEQVEEICQLVIQLK